MLTICEQKAKSVAQVEHRIVSGWVLASLVETAGRIENREKAFEKENVAEKDDGVVGLWTGLDAVESVGEELRDGTAVACGELLELHSEPRRRRGKGMLRLGSRNTGNFNAGLDVVASPILNHESTTRRTCGGT